MWNFQRMVPALRGLSRVCFSAAFAFLICFWPGVLPGADLKVADPDVRPVRPYRGLTYTADGIREVRRIARDTERGRALAAQIFGNAEVWLGLSDEAVGGLFPPSTAVLASGTAGDPKTNQDWPTAGRSGGVCDLSRPGTVRSPYTGDIYGNAAAGEPYYDGGDGWVRPADGKRFYFKGIWNSWIVQRMHEGVDDLALAYMLTGDESVAARGLLILDGLATLKAKRGEDMGFPDVPGYGVANKSFLAYSGNGANSRVFQTALSLDLLAGSKRAEEPSGGMPGFTIFDNLREHYFALYELNYKESRHTLYNHTTSLYANQIAQAVLFGRPEALAEGIEVVVTWLDQCLTRDGQYYENAGGYERVGVDYFADMMLPLMNYSPGNYENSGAFPDPGKYPFGLRFGNDPRWYSAAFLMKYRMMASGRMICFGDMWEDREVLPGAVRDWDPRKWCIFARLLYMQTDRGEWKEEIARRYWAMSDAVRNEPVMDPIRGMGMSQWLEPAKPRAAAAADDCLLDEPSDFLPGKMIALMRSGRGENHRTAFLSGSVHYSHGHDDQMSLLLYAKGMCLTGIYGYPFAGSPAHRGWSMKPASHWSLVVNEDLPAPAYPAKNSPPSSLEAFVGQSAGVSAQLVEMSNPYLWTSAPAIAGDLTEYRRLLWMVDVSAEDFYFLDFFRVCGGRVHDYFWTGQWLDQARPSEGFAVAGVRPASVAGVWSLAGLNGRYRGADYNVPGRSWGERLESGKSGRIASLGIPDEEINVDKNWNPPPGNGYGFIYDVRTTETTDNWSASWRLIDGKNTMRLTFVNGDGQEAITGRSPAFEEKRYHSLAIARRRGAAPLRSRFAGLIEVAAPGHWPVRTARWLDIAPETGMGVRLSLGNGCTDTVLAGAEGGSAIRAAGEISLRGSRGFVRQSAEGAVEEMLLHGGTELAAGGCGLGFASAAWEGKVLEVLPGDLDNRVVVEGVLPEGGRLAGRPAIFSGGADSPVRCLQDESYMVESVSRQGGGSVLHFGWQRLDAAQVVVDSVEEDGAVSTTWPNEIRGGRSKDTGYFTGRQVVASADPSRATRVVAYPDKKVFYPAEKGVFHPGEKLAFRVVQPGDVARINSLGALKRGRDGVWRLTATGDVTVRLPAKAGEGLYMMQEGRFVQVAEARGDTVECLIPIAGMPDGKAELRVGSMP